MTRGGLIPFDIVRMIIIRLISPSVESLDDWSDCISVLAVSRLWRAIGEPMLYANIVIGIEALHNGILDFHSNADLVVSNSFENHVRAAVVHMPPDMNRQDAIAAIFWHMPNSLATTLNDAGTMRRFWRVVQSLTFLLGGACIEPLLLAMPNLRYLFVESRLKSNPWMGCMCVFQHYSVVHQSSTQNNSSTFDEFAEFDFVASSSTEIIPTLNIQTSMTRMICASNSEQTPSTSRRRIVPSDDRVLFCAEYIRRLRILDLPERALSLGTNIDELRDRNPCIPKENYMRTPWFNIRYRSFISVPNTWFENFREGVTRYDLFAFNRNANDRLLQITTSIPAEVSESEQLPDNSSDDIPSSYDSDDGYVSQE